MDFMATDAYGLLMNNLNPDLSLVIKVHDFWNVFNSRAEPVTAQSIYRIKLYESEKGEKGT
jgi:hypothetical protein